VALLSVTPTTDEAQGGRITGNLPESGLMVRLRSSRDMRPLAYALLLLRSDDGTRIPAEDRYIGGTDPQVCRVSPGPIGAGFAGGLVFVPRSYNLRWLRSGVPSRSWQVWAEAWLTDGAADPDAVVPGFRDRAGGRLAVVSGGSAGAAGGLIRV
jgi:hypothetical protein